jgi:type II secretory pathway pseudopilin PulG
VSARDAGAGGFSLVELLIAMAMMVAFGSVVMALIIAGQSMARMQPEAADLQQRARVALQTLGAELAVAGAGFDRGPLAGSLARHFPPVVPSSDGGITMWYIAGREAQTTLVAPFAQGAVDVFVESGDAFSPASTAIVLDSRGCRDVLRIDEVTSTSLRIRPGVRGCDYDAGAAIGQGEVRTYRVDPATRQLLRRDGSDPGQHHRDDRRIPGRRPPGPDDVAAGDGGHQFPGAHAGHLDRLHAGESSGALRWLY